MTYLMTLALLLGQAGGNEPPDPLAKPGKAAAGKAADDLLNEPAKPAAPGAEGGVPGQPKDFKPAGAAEPGAQAAPGDGAQPGGDGTKPADGAKPGDGKEPDGSEAKPAFKSWGEWWKEVRMTGAMGIMTRGGIYMWPILFLGVIAIATIIERYRSLKMLTTDTQALRTQVRELLQNDRIEEALQLCEKETGPVAAILETGIRKLLVLRRLNYDPGKIEEQVVKSMDDYGVHIVAALERHLPILATVSSAAPMFGFLGTVAGMITSFQDIVDSLGKRNIVEAAADGIAEALITTEWGLVFGIPAFIAYNYFTGVINRFVLDVEETATDLIETVTLQMAIDEREKADKAASA